MAEFQTHPRFQGCLIVSKNKEDPVKNESAGVVTKLFNGFSDAQGPLTPKSVMAYSRNSNIFKLL